MRTTSALSWRVATLGLATSAMTQGCFYGVEEGPAAATSVGGAGGGASGAASASTGAGASGSTGSGAGAAGGAGGGAGGAGGGFVPPCSVRGSDCACPAGLQCINNCCEIVTPPATCGDAIDVTAGGWFHATVCGGPPPTNVDCDMGKMSGFLYLKVGQSLGGGFEIATSDPESLWIGDPCINLGCEGSPPWTIADNQTFAFQAVVDDPCSYDFAFEVIPK